jgi:hypothetical protein
MTDLDGGVSDVAARLALPRAHGLDADDTRLRWWWVEVKAWSDCALCSATIEPREVAAYRAVDGLLVDRVCAEREQLDVRASHAVKRSRVTP